MTRILTSFLKSKSLSPHRCRQAGAQHAMSPSHGSVPARPPHPSKPTRSFSILASQCSLFLFFLIGPRCMGADTADILEIEKPVFFWNPLWTLYITLAVIALVILFWLLVKLFRTLFTPAPPPRLSTEQRALKDLDEAHAWMSTEKAEPFCTEVSRILRRYLERRFRLPATELTTEEFFAREENLRRFSEQQRQELHQFSQQVDLVKFARWSLPVEELENLYSIARNCIERPTPPTGEATDKEGGTDV